LKAKSGKKQKLNVQTTKLSFLFH